MAPILTDTPQPVLGTGIGAGVAQALAEHQQFYPGTPPDGQSGLPQPQLPEIVGWVRACFDKACQAKEYVEDILLDNLYRRNGEYPPEKLAKIQKAGGTDIFFKITEVKCNAAEAWLSDIFAPADGKAWTLDHTPLPDLPPQYREMIVQRTMAAISRMIPPGAPMDPNLAFQVARQMREQVMAELSQEAKRRAEGMERKIDDQLREGEFNEAWDDGLDDLTTHGTMTIKGPFVRMKPSLEWRDGAPVEVMKPVESFYTVSVWNAFPSADSTTPNDGLFFIERVPLTRSSLFDMRSMPRFKADMIDRALEQYGDGHRERITVDDQVEQLAEKLNLDTKLNDGTIHALVYNGGVKGSALVEWGIYATTAGVDIEMEAEYEVEAWVIGNLCVGLAINDNPLRERPYSSTVWKKRQGSYWGKGICELMSDIQDAANAAGRALINNMAIASGPQAMIHDINRLAEGEDITSMYPWKIWQFKNDGLSQRDPISFFQPDANTDQLFSVFERFMAMADDRTVPAYSYGSDRVAGAGQTASGLSMLLTAAARTIKRVIALMDRNIFGKTIERLYVRNMLYDEDQSIKGDVRVVPKGALGMFVKEQQLLRFNEFQAIAAGPTYAQLLGPEHLMKILREYAKMQQLPTNLLPSDEDMRNRLTAQANAVAGQGEQGGQPQ